MHNRTLSKPFRRLIHSSSWSSTAKRYVDIVISGGGMVGTAMACALGNLKAFEGKTIALLESAPKSDKRNWKSHPFENRVSAITPGSCNFLKEIGVWSRVEGKRLNPFQSMQVWESISHGSISFDAHDIGEDHIAYIVENNVIVESCVEQVESYNQVEMKYGTKLINVTFPENKTSEELITVETNDGENISTKLLIGADGFNSFIRAQAGIETIDYDYNQSAVVATMKVNSSIPNKTAYQRYLTTGPIALLPLSSEWSSLVWSTSKSQAKELIGLSEEEFVAEVNEAFNRDSKSHFPSEAISNLVKSGMTTLQPGKYAGSVLKQCPKVVSMLEKSRGMFPLGMKHANHYVKSRTALIGDSAHRIHPMAGQGVNLGFGDAKSLSNTIDNSLKCGADFGTLDQLLPFETERQRHNVSIIAAINGLNTLFSTTAFPVVFARTMGLTMTDSIPFVKEQIVRHAMQ